MGISIIKKSQFGLGAQRYHQAQTGSMALSWLEWLIISLLLPSFFRPCWVEFRNMVPRMISQLMDLYFTTGAWTKSQVPGTQEDHSDVECLDPMVANHHHGLLELDWVCRAHHQNICEGGKGPFGQDRSRHWRGEVWRLWSASQRPKSSTFLLPKMLCARTPKLAAIYQAHWWDSKLHWKGTNRREMSGSPDPDFSPGTKSLSIPDSLRTEGEDGGSKPNEEEEAQWRRSCFLPCNFLFS